MTGTLLRGASALLGPGLAFERRPLDVLVEDDRISAIEPASSIHDAGAVIDLSRHLLVPGFINGHMHSHEHFHRGRTENLPLELWQHYVRTPVPVVLTPRQVYLRTAIGALESLRTGATCVVDDFSVGGAINRVLVDAVLQAYEDVGVRALVGFAMMDRPLVDTFPFADTLPVDLRERMRALPRPAASDYLGLVHELAATRHPRAKRVGVLVAPSAPQRCSQEFLVACAGLADELDLPLITHVQETRLQVVGSAAALSKVRGDDYSTWLSAREALAAATCGGARALGFGTSLGVIERGAIADLVAYRLDTLPFTPLNDPVRQLVYAERGAGLDFAMVAGEVMLRDGRFTRVDEARLLAEIETEVAGLAAQFAAADASVAPVRAAIETVYRRSLAASVPPDTYPARLP